MDEAGKSGNGVVFRGSVHSLRIIFPEGENGRRQWPNLDSLHRQQSEAGQSAGGWTG